MLSTAQRKINSSRRFESKYRISGQQYYHVKNALIPFMQLDPFASVAPKNRYLVRSLYFDTSDYQAYYEKIEGDCNRIKFRIRTYAETIQNNPPIRFELKVRRGAIVEKHGSFITATQYQEIINKRQWPQENNPVLVEFERNLYLNQLQPKILVEYLREGYQSRSREDIRITFDHKVRSAFSNSLFPRSVFFRSHHPHIIILEIKHYKRQPDWLKNIVQQQGLNVVENSKYSQGIEVARPDIVTPSWSAG